jgi:Arc/MetJ family transcription regulator
LRLDEELLAEARAVLGTKSATDTIHQALARLFQRLRSLDGLDLADETVMRSAWR